MEECTKKNLSSKTPETRSLPSSGVVTPITTLTTNLSLFHKVKGSAYRVVGLSDMLSVALETSSLPSSGVVTPSAISTMNLSLISQSKRHGLSSSQAKRHDLCGPRDKLSNVYTRDIQNIHFTIPYCSGKVSRKN